MSRRAKQNPIPTRHAVAHGLVAYSSQQSSLNAIFIADYVLSIVSRALRNKPEIDASNCLPLQNRMVPDMSVPITMYPRVSKFIALHKSGSSFATFCQFDRMVAALSKTNHYISDFILYRAS